MDTSLGGFKRRLDKIKEDMFISGYKWLSVAMMTVCYLQVQQQNKHQLKGSSDESDDYDGNGGYDVFLSCLWAFDGSLWGTGCPLDVGPDESSQPDQAHPF